MAKLRIDSIIGHLEFEGTEQEILGIYDGLVKRYNTSNPMQVIDVVPHKYDLSPHKLPSDYNELEKKMPSIGEIVAYILTKPKYEHDIVDIGKRFLGKQINSRKYGRLYRELSSRLDKARKSLEASQRGAFEQRPAPDRNLRIFTFKPVNATPLGLQPDKTS